MVITRHIDVHWELLKWLAIISLAVVTTMVYATKMAGGAEHRTSLDAHSCLEAASTPAIGPEYRLSCVRERVGYDVRCRGATENRNWHTDELRNRRWLHRAHSKSSLWKTMHLPGPICVTSSSWTGTKSNRLPP
jgi:hypothetical protein